MFLGLDLYYADPAQPLTTAGEKLDGLDHDLSDLSVRGMTAIFSKTCTSCEIEPSNPIFDYDMFAFRLCPS